MYLKYFFFDIGCSSVPTKGEVLEPREREGKSLSSVAGMFQYHDKRTDHSAKDSLEMLKSKKLMWGKAWE